MTKAEERLLETCRLEGEAWVAPSQHRMVRRLIRLGLLSCLPPRRRYNSLRGTTERRVTLTAKRIEGVEEA